MALLRNGAVPPERSQYALEIIQKNATAQTKLVTDLLDIARSLTGQIQLESGAASISTPPSAPSSSRRAAAAEARRISLSMTTEVRRCMVWGDMARLQQIAEHLLSNAIKFTPAGGQVSVALGRRQGSRRNSTSRNTGDAIEPAFEPHLFEPFRQAETGATRRYGGLGLGLAIVAPTRRAPRRNRECG